jgi:hypothetical protein
MEKLEKGYTQEELKAFSREAFRGNRRIRKSEDGGWETYVVTVTEPPHFEDTPVQPSEAPKKKGFWRRLFKN